MPQPDQSRFSFVRNLNLTVLVSLLFLIAQSASAQCTKKIPELPAAPELLGFRLGMTKEQIKARVPQTQFGGKDPFGVSQTTINPYFDPKIDKTGLESVRSISLDLLDDRLTSLWIGFDETYKVQDIDEFVKLISQSLQVTGNWSSWRTRGRQLRCADFHLFVSVVAGGPSLRLLDTGAENLVAERRQSKEEQDSVAEENTSEESEEEIIGDQRTKTYYPGGCQPAKPIAENDRVTFKNAAEAQEAGFKLAKNCPGP